MNLGKLRNELDYRENMLRIRLRCRSQRQADQWSFSLAVVFWCFVGMMTIIAIKLWS